MDQLWWKAIYKASKNIFFYHDGKIVLFRDTKQVNSFKKKYFNLYKAFRGDDGALYTRSQNESLKTIRYEDIPRSQLEWRDYYFKLFMAGNNDGKEDPYGTSYRCELAGEQIFTRPRYVNAP